MKWLFKGNTHMNTQASLHPVTVEFAPEDQRLDVVEVLFGMAFPLQLKPVEYGITGRMVGGNDGGYRHFFTLSNGCLYMWRPPRTNSSRSPALSVPGGALSGRHGDHGVSVCLKQPVVLPERHRTGIQHGAPGGQGDPEATD